MELKKLENRSKWILEVDGHSYVREEVDWYNDDKVTIDWYLNEDVKKGAIYLMDDRLEKLFWENNSKPYDGRNPIPAPEKVETPKLEMFEIEVPEGKKLVRTDLEDGILITFEDIEKVDLVIRLCDYIGELQRELLKNKVNIEYVSELDHPFRFW